MNQNNPERRPMNLAWDGDEEDGDANQSSMAVLTRSTGWVRSGFQRAIVGISPSSNCFNSDLICEIDFVFE